MFNLYNRMIIGVELFVVLGSCTICRSKNNETLIVKGKPVIFIITQKTFTRCLSISLLKLDVLKTLLLKPGVALFIKWARLDSNQRLLLYESSALTTELQALKLAYYMQACLEEVLIDQIQ